MSEKKKTEKVETEKIEEIDFKKLLKKEDMPLERRYGPCGGCDLIPTPPRNRVR